jgi:hypothetical protein
MYQHIGTRDCVDKQKDPCHYREYVLEDLDRQ